MIDFNGQITSLSKDLMTGKFNVTVQTQADLSAVFNEYRDKPLNIALRPQAKRRSIDANSFCWALCKDIGDALKPPIPKEEIYRKAIKDVGGYYPLPIRADAVESFSRTWSANGVGWFVDVVDDSKLDGYKLVFSYYGSSTYTAQEMSRLIDYLVDDAKQMGLPIPLSKERTDELIERWSK